MSEPIAIAVLAAIPPTVMAFAALVQSVRNGRKADTISTKTEQIHVLTNSNLTSVKADLALANEKIQELERLVQTLVERRDAPPVYRAP